jgi:hypothetical protein
MQSFLEFVTVATLFVGLAAWLLCTPVKAGHPGMDNFFGWMAFLPLILIPIGAIGGIAAACISTFAILVVAVRDWPCPFSVWFFVGFVTLGFFKDFDASHRYVMALYLAATYVSIEIYTREFPDTYLWARNLAWVVAIGTHVSLSAIYLVSII